VSLSKRGQRAQLPFKVFGGRFICRFISQNAGAAIDSLHRRAYTSVILSRLPASLD